MCIGGWTGCEITVPGDLRPDVFLFSESTTRWVIEVKETDSTDVVKFLGSRGIPSKIIGHTGGDKITFNKINGSEISLELEDADSLWRKGITSMME